MFRSRASERARGAVLAGVLLATALACGEVKQWERRPGALVLSAEPLPPVAGMPLKLAVAGSNVGPIDVYQGDVRVATFANIELDGKASYSVTAVSDLTPRAVAVGYDYEHVEVNATGFSSPPGPDRSPGTGGSGTMRDVPVEACEGVVETPGACSSPTGTSVMFEVYNGRQGSVTLYRRDPMPGICFNQIQAILPPGASRKLQQVSGNVMLMVDDATATALREITLPATASCLIVL